MNDSFVSTNQNTEIDSINSYFECITECSIVDGHQECITRCLEVHLKGDNQNCIIHLSFKRKEILPF